MKHWLMSDKHTSLNNKETKIITPDKHEKSAKLKLMFACNC